MPRRGNVPKREVLPDPLYNSVLVTRLVNNIMLDGKKGVAQKIVYGAFEIIGEKTGKAPLDVFMTALENIMPFSKSGRRVGGAIRWRSKSAPKDGRLLTALARQLRQSPQRKDNERTARRRDFRRANNTDSAVKKREHAQDG